jgi:rod shape-determining protein MreC
MLKNTFRKWWELRRLQIALLGLAVTAAWGVRQTQGAALFEVYNLVTRPFQSNGSRQEQLISARTQELQAQLLELETQNQKLKELLGYVSAKKPRRDCSSYCRPQRRPLVAANNLGARQ